MKIALINSEYPSPTGSDNGGIATYTYSMAKALAIAGHTVYVFVRQGTSEQTLPQGVQFNTYSYKPPSRVNRIIERFYDGSIRWELGHSRDIKEKLIEIRDRDGLDIAEFPEYGGLASACTFMKNIGIIITFHTPSELVDKLNDSIPSKKRIQWYKFEQLALKHAHGFRSPSQAMKSEIHKMYPLKNKNFEVIRNPLFTEHFNTIEKKRKDSSFDILFAGRLEQRKGAGLILQVIKDILKIDRKVTISFAGESAPAASRDYRSAIENTLDEELRSRVYFLGPLSFKDLSILYCRSSLFLFPSVFENAPYALYEAIAAKLPVVASASGGIQEIIRHKETGLLFSHSNPVELIDCIKTAMGNYTICEKMAENAYDNLYIQHSPEKIAKDSVVFYNTALAHSRMRARH